MRYTTVFVLGLLVVVAGMVNSTLSADSAAVPQDAGARRQPIAPPPPPHRQPAAPPAPYPAVDDTKISPEQRTRVQVEVYEFDCPIEKLQSLDLDKLAAIPSLEVTKQLKELGEGGLQYRLDLPLQLSRTQAASVKCGANVPVVNSMSGSGKGSDTRSVSYKDTGIVFQITGAWLNEGSMADVLLELEWSSIASSGVDVGAGITLPQFNQYRFRNGAKVKSGHSVMLLVNHGVNKSEQQAKSRVGIVRLALTQMKD